MTTATRLKLAAYVLFALGFLIPFGASHWKGTPLTAHPVALAATAGLWVAGMLLEYRAYALERAETGTPLWRRLCDFVGRGAASWLVLGIAFGFVYYPTVSNSFFGTNFNSVLAITLAVMGIQISPDDWRRLVRSVRPVIILVLLRWIVMPLVGYCVSFAVFHPFLPEATANQLAVGMILLATSPTGAASNSMTLISKGDLALSVSATTVNVLVAPFLQPFLVKLLAGSVTSVDASGMFLELLEYVLAPVVVATLVGFLFPRLVERIKPALPAVAVLSLACVLMGTISRGTATILAMPGVIGFIVAACLVHGILGMTLGYTAPKYLGFSRAQRVASCFEVGIENAAIAPALAIGHFGPLALLPALVYGKTQNLLAVTLFAPYFQRRAERDDARLPTSPTTAGVAPARDPGEVG
jgi:bile acid:Na+ symporter, BASS family